MDEGGGRELVLRVERLHPRERLGMRIFSPEGQLYTTVVGVTPNSPSDRAGVLAGDVLLAIDRNALLGASHSAVVSALAATSDQFTIRVARPEKTHSVDGSVDSSEERRPLPVGLADELYSGGMSASVPDSPGGLEPPGATGSPSLDGYIRSGRANGVGGGGGGGGGGSYGNGGGGDGGDENVKGNDESTDEAKFDQAFASLLQVKLPAQYQCKGVTRLASKPGPCAVHLEPRLGSEKLGLTHPGEYVTVVANHGVWLQVETANACGWIHGGSGGSEFLCPVPPKQEYAWQRARGSGLYDSVLAHRKGELRRANLAEQPELLKEWMVVIAELDVALRVRAKVDAAGRLTTEVDRRPRARSFQTPRRGWGLWRSHGVARDNRTARKRSNSFAVQRTAQNQNRTQHQQEPPDVVGMRNRWRVMQEKNKADAWDARTHQRKNALLTERRSGRPMHLALGRLARDRAEAIVHSPEKSVTRNYDRKESPRSMSKNGVGPGRLTPERLARRSLGSDSEFDAGNDSIPSLRVLSAAPANGSNILRPTPSKSVSPTPTIEAVAADSARQPDDDVANNTETLTGPGEIEIDVPFDESELMGVDEVFDDDGLLATEI